MRTELSPRGKAALQKSRGQGSGVAHSPSANLRGGRARRLLPPALTPLPHLPRERDGGPMRAVPAALTRRNIRVKDRKRKQPRGCPRATQFGTLFGKINHPATFQENRGGWREREKAVWKRRNSLQLSIHNQKRGREIQKHNMLLMTFPLNTNI